MLVESFLAADAVDELIIAIVLCCSVVVGLSSANGIRGWSWPAPTTRCWMARCGCSIAAADQRAADDHFRRLAT